MSAFMLRIFWFSAHILCDFMDIVGKLESVFSGVNKKTCIIISYTYPAGPIVCCVSRCDAFDF